MKKINKLLPILEVASIATIATPIFVSCNRTEDNLFSDETLKWWANEFLDYKFNSSLAQKPQELSKLKPVYEETHQYFNEESSGRKCYGVAQVAGCTLEGIARQADAESKIKITYSDTLRYIKNNLPYMAIGFGIAGAQGVLGISRQPECENKIRDCLLFGFEIIKMLKTEDQTVGMGIATSQAAMSVARQPEAESNIRQTLMMGGERIKELNGQNIPQLSNYVINTTKTNSYDDPLTFDPPEPQYLISAGKGTHIGVITGTATENIARQPEAADNIKENCTVWWDIIQACDTLEKSAFIQDVGASTIVGIARNQEFYPVVYIIDNAFKGTYPKASTVRAKDLQMIVSTFNESFFRNPGTLENGLKAAELMSKMMKKIVEIDSDAKAFEISKLSVSFILDTRYVEEAKYDEIEDTYLEEVDKILKQ